MESDTLRSEQWARLRAAAKSYEMCKPNKKYTEGTAVRFFDTLRITAEVVESKPTNWIADFRFKPHGRGSSRHIRVEAGSLSELYEKSLKRLAEPFQRWS